MRIPRKVGSVFAATAVALLLMPAKSEAVLITSAGQTFGFSWDFACGAAGNCTGDAQFEVDSVTSTSLGLTVTVNNTLNTSFALFLTSLGFDLDPAATDIDDFTGGSFLTSAELNQVFPSANTLNICVQSGSSPGSCGAGNPNDGIPSPGSDTFSIVLTGLFGTSGVELSNFHVQYMGEPGSFQGGGEETPGEDQEETPGEEGEQVPEPLSLALLGLGALFAGHRARRRFA